MSTRKPKPPSPHMPEVVVDKEITVAAARAALLKEKLDRQMACGHEIEDILKKYNCELIAVPMITDDGRIMAQARIGSKA